MLFVLLTWLAQFLLWSGIGWLVYAQLFRLSGGWSIRDFFRSCWIGFGTLVAVAQLYSLGWPLTGRFVACAALVALPGLWWQARAAREHLRTAPTPRGRWRTLLFWLVLALCALRIAAGLGLLEWSGAYDSDLYHFSSVRWAKEFPAVPGLANLHAPLGVSSTYLLYAAIVDHGCCYREAAWIVPGVFAVLFVAQLLWLGLCAPAADRRTRLLALLLLAYAMLMSCEMVPSLYYDRPALICLCVAVLELMSLTATATDARESLAGIFSMLLLAAVSVSIKPVGAVSALLLAVAGLALAWRRLQHTACWRVMFLPVVLAAGLLARNAVLSGWLLYPAPQGRLPVSWAVPEHAPADAPHGAMHAVADGYALFQAWARQPGPDYRQAMLGGAWSWLGRWWAQRQQAVELKLFGGGLLLLVLGLWPGRRRARLGLLHYAIFLTGANLVFWFCTAPDLRFGEGFFWLWFALNGALVLQRCEPWPRAQTFALVLAFAALLLARPGWRWPEKIGAWHIGHAQEARCHAVVLSDAQHPPLQVLVPDNDDRAGDAPLPSTPYPCDALRCRVPGELRHGFYIAQPRATP